MHLNPLERVREERERVFEERQEHRSQRHEGRDERRHERFGGREGLLREHSGERRHERFGGREGLLREHSGERHRPQHYDQDPPYDYAPPSGAPPGELSRADFVSDDDFQRMMRSGEFEKPRTPGFRPEDSGEWDRSRPPANHGYQPSYQQPPSQEYQRYPEPPLPSVPHEQRPSGYGYESNAYSQPHNSYSVPETLEQRHGGGAYAPPAGAPGAHSSYTPAGGFSPPPGPPYGYDTSQAQGRESRGAANDYYNGPPPGQQAHPYSHIPDLAAAHSDSSDPALYQQYHEAAHGLHQNYQSPQPHQSGEFDEEKYSSHFAAHTQAYGSDFDGKPMANDDIGAAAAVEALKITAANNQQSGGRPQQGGRPQGGFQSQDQQSGRPSGGKPQGRPQSAETGDDFESEDVGPAAKPHDPTGGGGPQDKIVALAMAQAGKLFDKKGGGGGQGKTDAMQTAAATAMRMMTEYKSTGKVDMQPGEMQKLMGLAMSLF